MGKKKKKNIINNLSKTTMLKSIKTKFKQGASHAFFPNSRGQEVMLFSKNSHEGAQINQINCIQAGSIRPACTKYQHQVLQPIIFSELKLTYRQ
jgi:hypothetical protein